MKVRCDGCKDYKVRKRLPDYQVTFNNWCDLYQTPCALIKKCNLYPDLLKSLPKPKIHPYQNTLFNVFVKRESPPPPPFVK